MDRSPLETLVNFLDCSPTAFHAVHNAAAMLSAHGFTALSEDEEWHPQRGKAYYVKRNDSALIAFRIGNKTPESAFRIVASHTDSPALKLKENPALSDGTFTRLNVEPYGGGIFYSFLDRPLTIAGRIVREKEGRLVSELFESRQNVVIPSLAIHMDRTVNEKFAPNPQTDLLPLYALGKEELGLDGELHGAIAFDLFAACKEPPFFSGKHGEFLSAPRIDNLSSVAASLWALGETKTDDGIGVAACFDSEEVGSRTLQGAGSGFLKSVLSRIADGLGLSEEQRERMLARSFMISLDNAHSVHPNHPEKCDPTNRAVMGGGIVIKGHAGGAYTTDAASSAVIKRIFQRADVKFQTFFNRSDMRSGSTLGAISLSSVSIRTVDLGLAQLAMHSAVETFAHADYTELLKGLSAFYEAPSSDLLVHSEP